MQNSKFKVGDLVLEKGTTSPIWKITSNVPVSAVNAQSYLSKDIFQCTSQEDGKVKRFKGEELEFKE